VPVAGDLVHAPSLAVPPARGRPLVVTVPDVVFLHQPEVLTRRGVKFHERGLRIARREAAAVIAFTEFGREELLKEGFDAKRVHVARPGVEVTAAPTGVDAHDILGGLGVHHPYLLFQSTIEPRKGLPDLLEAHRRLRVRHPGLSLVVRGDAGWGAQPDLSGPGVHRVGRVSERELDVLYRSAVALAHPARYEGFGFGIVEAMARGCPVVTTDASCLPEVAGGAAILVRPGDVGALTDALDGLLRDDASRARLAEAGRVHAAGFTVAASAEAQAAVYRSVLR
jgi:glycosyltransferase involved in cell wall biosynthesis